ncbi:MAG: hypothetical protein M1839_001947 [Geoglossum umbratile]|nr:MAG: hypothetical protein M1839_001947 [Geoglossum umbratile]
MPAIRRRKTKASSAIVERKGSYTLGDSSESPAKRAQQVPSLPKKDGTDDSYMPSDHSSAAFYSDAEDEDVSDLDDENPTLGKPNMEEEQEEIASDMEEEEDGAGKIIRKSGGVKGKEVESRAKKDIRFQVNQRRHIKRFKAMLNRTYLDAHPYNTKDSEIEDIIDWSQEDPGARYHLVPDEDGNIEKKGNGSYRQLGTGNRYKRAGKTQEDGGFQIESA